LPLEQPPSGLPVYRFPGWIRDTLFGGVGSSPSLSEFRNIFNPALRSAYLTIGARFVDVTAAIGAYTPLAQTTVDQPYGTVPVAVADVCNLTYYCQLQDVHPTKAGYAVIARLIVAKLKSS
jgi:hypothetical protein